MLANSPRARSTICAAALDSSAIPPLCRGGPGVRAEKIRNWDAGPEHGYGKRHKPAMWSVESRGRKQGRDKECQRGPRAQNVMTREILPDNLAAAIGSRGPAVMAAVTVLAAIALQGLAVVPPHRLARGVARALRPSPRRGAAALRGTLVAVSQ